MTQPKQVANTLKTVLDTVEMDLIINRGSDIEPVIQKVSEWWSYDLYSRSPGPAYRDGVFVGTDLDLACFLYALAERKAVINIPRYKSMRQKSTKEGQVVTSKDNRHGAITGLSSNKDVFSFSVRIKDMNVITTEEVGDFRNFSLTNLEGEWYKGWDRIQFLPTAPENSFLTESKLWSGNTVIFKNFVHPNRWTSFYGQYYFITKSLIGRLEEEANHLYGQVKRMLDEGIKYPETDAPKEWPKTTKEGGKSVKVKAFQVEIDLPENETKFPDLVSNQINLVEATRRRKAYVYGIIPKLRFATRSTELAYYKFGEGRFPSWLKNVQWEQGFKLPRKRIAWDRLVLFQPKVGERGVAIRKREYEKSEIVSDETYLGTNYK